MLVVSCCSLPNGSAQKSRYFLMAGMGNYESGFAGAGINLGKNNFLALACGSNFSTSGHSYFSVSLEDNQSFLAIFDQKLKVNLLAKTFYWLYEDEYYTFQAIGLHPGSGLSYAFNNNLTIDAALGPVFNIQLKSDRKNNEAAGWPNQTDFNYMVRLLYHF